MVVASCGMWASYQPQFECRGRAVKRHPGSDTGRHRGRTHRSTAICWSRDRPNRRVLVVACREFGPPMDLQDPNWIRGADRVLLGDCPWVRRVLRALLQGTVL